MSRWHLVHFFTKYWGWGDVILTSQTAGKEDGVSLAWYIAEDRGTGSQGL